MRKTIFLFIVFLQISLYGQRINPEYLPKNAKNTESNSATVMDNNTSSKSISNYEPSGCIQTANESFLNSTKITSCLKEVSVFVDSLEKQKPKPKKKIKYWKKILNILEDKNKRFRKAQENRIQRVRREKEEQARVETNSNLDGCSLSDVYINLKYQKIKKFGLYHRYGLAVRIQNQTDSSIDVNSPSLGTIIKGLCSGGSVTFYLYLGMNDDRNGKYISLLITKQGDSSFNRTISDLYIEGNWGYNTGLHDRIIIVR